MPKKLGVRKALVTQVNYGCTTDNRNLICYLAVTVVIVILYY